MTLGIIKCGNVRMREVENIVNSSYTATGIVGNLTATSVKSFITFIPLEIQVNYVYWSQDEQQAGNYQFPTYIYGIKTDGTTVQIATFSVSDRFGNISGSRILQLNTQEEFEKISVCGKNWKYKSGSSISFVLKKAKIKI